MGLMKQRWTQIVDEEAVDIIVEEDMDEDDPLQEIIVKMESPQHQDLPCDVQLKLEFHTTWHTYK